MKATTIEAYKAEILRRANEKIEQAEHDYNQAINDCKNGLYDKWFRYHRDDVGHAYDLGWMGQNIKTQNETVKFI